MTSRTKEHLKKYKTIYIVVGTSVVVAGITTLIMRANSGSIIIRDTIVDAQRDTIVLGKRSTPNNFPQPIGFTIGEAAQSTIGVLGEKVDIKDTTLNVVSYFSSGRQGPPSWVVRCLETGDVFTSQRAAAFAMGLAQDHLSNHLNGIRDNVNGFHFERICMAA